ncbi:hypothetical protein ES703_106599 [subsurface metagenome]
MLLYTFPLQPLRRFVRIEFGLVLQPNQLALQPNQLALQSNQLAMIDFGSELQQGRYLSCHTPPEIFQQRRKVTERASELIPYLSEKFSSLEPPYYKSLFIKSLKNRAPLRSRR